MNDLATPLSHDQATLLQTMADQYLGEGKWPTWHFLVHTLDQKGLDADEVIRSLPRVGSQGHVGPSYGLTSYVGPHISDDQKISLTIAAGLHVTALQAFVVPRFLEILQGLVEFQGAAVVSAQDAQRPEINPGDLAAHFPGIRRDFILEWLPDILAGEPATRRGSSRTDQNGIWHRELDRELRHYRNAVTLDEYVMVTTRRITEQAAQYPAATPFVPVPSVEAQPGPYINEGLITDLEGAETGFKLDKLIALARELNANYAEQHPYACHMLLRAIIDHVPPAFNQEKFDGVVANVAWSQTDKAYVKKLGEFRKPADDVLHRQIGTWPSRITIHDMPLPSYVNALLQGLLDRLTAIPTL
ncbi:hypothetical protein ACWF95_08780 [Streptomyces vinaceus]